MFEPLAMGNWTLNADVSDEMRTRNRSWTIGETVAMTLSGGIVFMPKADYEALREYQRARKPLAGGEPDQARPLDPELVGRLDRRNVVIGKHQQELERLYQD